MEIKVSNDKLKKIKKYVDEKRYKTTDAFFEQAAYLLIMAEEQKDLMKKEGIHLIGKDVDLNSSRKNHN